MMSMKELDLIIYKQRQQLNIEKIEIEKKLKASQNKQKVMPNDDDKLQKNVVKESENNKENKLNELPIEVPPLNLPKPNNDNNEKSENNKENKLNELPIEVPPLNLPKPNNDNNENSKILIENKNNIDKPLNNNSTPKNITTQQTQKYEKKSKSKTFQGDIRDNEKARLAKLFEISEPTIISDINSNKVGNIFRINNNNNNNNKMISNNNNESGSKVSTPILSKREFEINRLAELFENSETSSVRNYHMQQEIAKKCASNCILPTTSSFLDLPVDHSDDEVTNDGGNYPGSFNPNEDESPIHPINSIHSIPDDIPNENNDLDRNEIPTSVNNGAHIPSNNLLAPPKVFVTTPTLTNGPSSPNMLLSGLEEQDERRKQFMEQRKKDYFDYMQQARLQMRNSRPVGFCTHRSSLRDVSTQTDFDRYNNNRLEPVPMSRPTFLMDNNNDYNYYNTNRDKITSRGTCTSGPISPSHSDRSNTSPVRSPRGRDLHRSTNCLPGSPFLSPCTPTVDKTNIMETCCDGGVSVSNTHIKQYIYREELKKQIEERQRLEAERKEKEKREEEAIERRVREQQERLRRQYELEEAQRIEYAMRRHIQDDLIRQRLTEADIRTMHNIACNRQRPTVLQSTNNAPFISPDDRPLPLPDKDKKDKQPKGSTTTTNNNITNNNTSSTNPTTSDKQGAINNNRPTKPINLNRSNSNNNNQKNAEIADPLIGVDLLADNGDNLLDDIDNKLTINDNTIPVLSPDLDNDNHTNDDDGLSDNIGDIVSDNNRSDGSKSPVVPALQTRMRIINNPQMLQDKWQVPAVEKTYIRPTALYDYPTQPVELHHQQLPLSHLDYINTNQDSVGNFRNNESSCNSSVRSDNVLTQLGSFRRQLQLEHLRMQERLYNQQLGHQRLQMPNTNPPNIKTATVSTTRS